MYANTIEEREAPLDKCVGFTDSMKVRMQPPGGHGTLERRCFSGQKKFHCFVYQTLCAPDSLVFAQYGPVFGRCHNIKLFHESGSENFLPDFLM